MKLTGRRCQCRSCGLFFNSAGAFDQHRRGAMARRQCKTPEMLRSEGHALDKYGAWTKRQRTAA